MLGRRSVLCIPHCDALSASQKLNSLTALGHASHDMAALSLCQCTGCRNVATADTVESLLNVGRDMLPKNIIKASAESSYLGIMVAACAALPLVCITLGVSPVQEGTANCRCGWEWQTAMSWIRYSAAMSLEVVML